MMIVQLWKASRIKRLEIFGRLVRTTWTKAKKLKVRKQTYKKQLWGICLDRGKTDICPALLLLWIFLRLYHQSLSSVVITSLTLTESQNF